MSKYQLAGGEAFANAVSDMFKTGLDDYHLEPLNLTDAAGKPVGLVKPGDGVIFTKSISRLRSGISEN